ncbi:MOSC domain-containing protein [Jatrophihabitans sp. DSM 45814]
MRLSSLHIYPVKSTRSIDLELATVEPWGLRYDRRWMVIDEHGANITARTNAKLFSVTATPQPENALLLDAPESEPLYVSAPTRAGRLPVQFSRLEYALAAGTAADDWISQAISQSAHLVWLDDPKRRAVSERHGGRDNDVMSLADAGPLLLTHEASLARLNAWIAEESARTDDPDTGAREAPQPLSMMRFRPNVVISSDTADQVAPFAEDGWSALRIGNVTFRTSELCDRCVMTTVDPITLERGKEPIRTIARHRNWSGATWFGTRLIPVTTGTLRVGDPVSIS